MKMTNLPALTLLLCIVCSVTVAPVMARERTDSVEDGVHLVKIEGYPTQVDRIHYSIYPTQTIVVDGTHDYWIQIGRDEAARLSSNELVRLLCGTGVWISVVAGGSVVGWILVSRGDVKKAVFYIVTFIWGNGAQKLADGIADVVCPKLEKLFIDEKYKHSDADGCILLKIGKGDDISTVKTELKKIGINWDTIKHIDASKSDL